MLQQKFLYWTTFMIIVTATIMSFTSNALNVNNNSGKKSAVTSTASIAYVYPNPESGALNLFCSSGLEAPLSLTVINEKGNTVKTISSLGIGGSNHRKYVQFPTHEIVKGEYNIIVSDLSGNSCIRRIYIQK